MQITKITHSRKFKTKLYMSTVVYTIFLECLQLVRRLNLYALVFSEYIIECLMILKIYFRSSDVGIAFITKQWF